MRILTLVLVAVTIGSGQDAGPHPMALVGGTVVDVSAFGTSTADIRDAVVIVEHGRITAAGPRRVTKIPRGAEVIDTTGKFIVPGLHDVFARGGMDSRRVPTSMLPSSRRSIARQARGIWPAAEPTRSAPCRASRCTPSSSCS